MLFAFYDWRGEQMNIGIGLCCLLISFSTREYSILLTAFFISFPNSPSLQKKRARFSSPSSSPSFSSPPPCPQPSPIIRYQCLVLHRPNPQTMPMGQAQRLTLRPTQVSTPFSIPVCFRAQALLAYRYPLSLYRSPGSKILAATTETPARRGRGRPKGSKNKKSGTSTTEATGEEAPKRKRGRPPKVCIILISYTCRVQSSHHSSFPYSLSHTYRERPRMRVSIPHRSVNAVVLPRIPSRTLMKTLITSSLLLNLAPRRGRGQVDRARSQMIDTTYYLSYSEVTTIPQERLIPHVQDSPRP
ncbi:hypothetical protein BDM02DRAFT_1938936 [Thelephora ganbajun]|uniref:Uncharacterized protein n=1 Tax=Thelephora ganbajun TaxID=370292 RepID=A0ACB6Z0I0_THEGA|nr:hypothetical protein BDM02DRAFT_1938936 [Thelephora ganbajun]